MSSPTDLFSHALRRDLHVRQVFDARHQRFSYVIACVRTNAAALINPSPFLAGPLAALVAESSFKPRFVLYSCHELGAGAPATAARGESHIYHGMLASLGVSVDLDAPDDDDEVTVDSAALWWSKLPSVRPVATGTDAGVVAVDAGDTRVLLRQTPRPGDDPAWTLGGSLYKPAAGAVLGQLRVALGAYHLLVVPVRRQPASVAFVAPGSVFIGTNPSQVGWIDSLPADTLIYGAQPVEGQFVCNAAQLRQRSALAAQAPGGRAPGWKSAP